MRAQLLFLTLLILVYLNSNAVSTDYRAVYDFEYTKDSINSITGKDILFLEISGKSSFCFSYYTYQTDSMRSTPTGRAVWRELFSAAIKKDGINATSFPHKRSTFKITKTNGNDTILIKDVIDDDIFQYTTSKKEFDWQITDSLKVINGYESCQAICNYHGRQWIVWFSPKIPVNDGPWVLCGLPGLIIKAYDKDKLFSFTLIRFSPNQDSKTDWTEIGKKTTRKEFLKKNYQYLKNRNLGLNAEIGINLSSEKDTRYLYGLEPDFKR